MNLLRYWACKSVGTCIQISLLILDNNYNAVLYEVRFPGVEL